jgi:GT2 family glycosyltransferase
VVSNDAKVGVVVPTLGQRPELIIECLSSIRKAGECFIQLVTPHSFDYLFLQNSGLIDGVVADPSAGLAAAINLGIMKLPESCEYVSWLGDDDLLMPNGLNECENVLFNDEEIVLVFGNCEYIDSIGDVIWKNNFGKLAIKLLRIGPCLIPQPGSLFRRDIFQRIGGLDTNFGWAFDFDLFIKFSKVGKIEYINKDLAAFRWHSGSLTVKERKKSVLEASRARSVNQTRFVRVLVSPLEPMIRVATLYGPKIFSRD